MYPTESPNLDNAGNTKAKDPNNTRPSDFLGKARGFPATFATPWRKRLTTSGECGGGNPESRLWVWLDKVH